MFAFITPSSDRFGPAAILPAQELDLRRLTGEAAWARLPAAVQRRFAPDHADVTYRGCMDLRCSRIGRVYALLARLWGSPLTTLNAQAVPSTVCVSRNGRGGVVWERRFHRAAPGAAIATDRHCTVRSTKELDASGRLLERTDGGLSMSLEVLEEHGALVFRSQRFWWVRGRWRVPLPLWMTPGTCRVAHTDLGAGEFRFTLSMEHPWWGETFYQCGVFTDPFPAVMPAPTPASAFSSTEA